MLLSLLKGEGVQKDFVSPRPFRQRAARAFPRSDFLFSLICGGMPETNLNA